MLIKAPPEYTPVLKMTVGIYRVNNIAYNSRLDLSLMGFRVVWRSIHETVTFIIYTLPNTAARTIIPERTDERVYFWKLRSN